MAFALLDTNLLVLLIVGATDESLVSDHKRLTRCVKKDFAHLSDHLAQYQSITTTPHVLAETSNYLLDTKSNFRDDVMTYFKAFIEGLPEQHIPANDLAQSIAFSRLGVADSGLLNQQFANCVLLTDDGNLHTEALRLGHAAIHFNELREIQL